MKKTHLMAACLVGSLLLAGVSGCAANRVASPEKISAALEIATEAKAKVDTLNGDLIVYTVGATAAASPVYRYLFKPIISYAPAVLGAVLGRRRKESTNG